MDDDRLKLRKRGRDFDEIHGQGSIDFPQFQRGNYLVRFRPPYSSAMDDDMKLQKRSKLPRMSADQIDDCTEECQASINRLTDDLLLQIISLLPLKQAVQTSFLSRRWKDLWTSIDKVQFNYSDHWWPEELENTAARIMEKFMCCYQGQKIRRFNIVFPAGGCNARRVDPWILFALSHDVEEFLFRSVCSDYKMPSNIFQSRWLTELRLTSCWVQMPSSVCLPSLKILFLIDIEQSADAVEFILTKCPSLENLSILHCFDGQRLVISVGSLNFRSLTIQHSGQIAIDAPSVQSLELGGYMRLPMDLLITNLSSLIRINLKRFSCHGLMQILDQLQHVRNVQLSVDCIQDLSTTTNLTPIMATCLEFKIWLTTTALLRRIRTVLSIFPAVETLIFVFIGEEEPLTGQKGWKSLQRSFSKLMKRIKTIEMHEFISSDSKCLRGSLDDMWRICEVKIELLSIVLENSTCLEKVVITFNKHGFEQEQQHLFKMKLTEKLQSFNRASPAAKIYVVVVR